MNQQQRLRQIPKVDNVLEWAAIKALSDITSRAELLLAIRSVLANLRGLILSGNHSLFSEAEIALKVAEQLKKRNKSSLRHVVNATGVVIHTNLGRSPLAEQAEQAIHEVACCYSNLEFNLEAGERGTRYSHIEKLLCELSGADSALVVNNNAAAVILALSSIAKGQEVVISRGELVEIGGSFRIPDVMLQSGAKLIEVGTTNCTHPKDYQSAVTESTALLLKVHTSNFSIVGFTSETTVEELSAIAKPSKVAVMVDAGSGCLIDLAPYGISGEPTIRQYLDAGADLVSFSGDKLLGGPQAGIIVGRRDLIDAMKRHPLLRALRVDKLSLAALEATLRLYRDQHQAIKMIPTLRMLTTEPSELAERADIILKRAGSYLKPELALLKHHGESSVGGGAFPMLKLPTTLIEVKIYGVSAQQIEQALRMAKTAIIGRIHKERFLLDLRTILGNDIEPLIASLEEITAKFKRDDK